MIHVHSFYQNATGVKIPAGEYANDDPVLQGLANYLIENGHAMVLDSEPFGVDIDLSEPKSVDNIPKDFSHEALKLMKENQLTAEDFAGFDGKVTVNDVKDKIRGK